MDSALALYREAAHFNAAAGETVPPAFAERLREAGRLAWAIGKLRRQREQIGFVPVPLGEYLRGLASVAAVALAPVLAWVGVSSTEPFDDEASASGLARLGEGLGMGFRQLLLHLRIGLVERAEGAPVAVLLASRAPGGHERPLVEECDAMIREVEQQYAAADLARLQRLEKTLHDAYAAKDTAAR